MKTPDEIYAELFHAVQVSGIFEDSKTFVDCTPKLDPEAILRTYHSLKDREDFSLAEFVSDHFDLPIVSADIQQNRRNRIHNNRLVQGGVFRGS